MKALQLLLILLAAKMAIAQSPQILQHPQRRDVTAGMSAVFRVEATGTGTLSYQWKKADQELPGEMDSVLQLDDVQPTDSGSYSAVVSEGANQMESNPAMLNVRSPLNNRALSLDGDGDYVQMDSEDRFQNPSALTIEFWFKPTPTSANKFGAFVTKGDGFDSQSDRTYDFRWTPDEILTISLFFVVVENEPDFAFLPIAASSNLWTHVALTFDSETGQLNLFRNGQLDTAITTFEGLPLEGRTVRQSSQPLVFGIERGFNDTHASGRLDEVRIWDHARLGLAIAADYSCKLTGQETGLVGYWPFDDGGVDDFTGFESHGVIFGDAHTELISQGDLPVMGCEQPAFLQAEIQTDTFKTAVKTQLGKSVAVEGSTDLDSWSPAGSVPNSLGRQDISETVLPGMKAFRAISR